MPCLGRVQERSGYERFARSRTSPLQNTSPSLPADRGLDGLDCPKSSFLFRSLLAAGCLKVWVETDPEGAASVVRPPVSCETVPESRTEADDDEFVAGSLDAEGAINRTPPMALFAVAVVNPCGAGRLTIVTITAIAKQAPLIASIHC